MRPDLQKPGIMVHTKIFSIIIFHRLQWRSGIQIIKTPTVIYLVLILYSYAMGTSGLPDIYI